MQLFSGKSARIVCAVAVSLLVVSILLTGCQGTPQEQPTKKLAPSLRLDPGYVAPGGKITISGAGFVPGEQIVVYIDKEATGEANIALSIGAAAEAVLVVNKNGAFGGVSSTFAEYAATPESTPPGFYTVVARGNKGSEAAAPLEVRKK